MGLIDEIHEQPDSARRLIDRARPTMTRISGTLRRHRPAFVVIAARGSSDHAAVYAQYLLGVRNSLPVALATPSAITLYGGRPRFAGGLVVGISQSGQSPDIVAVIEEGRRQGVATLAITNEPDSPLARAAGDVIELHAGVESATAASKTYTTELLAVALLSLALDEGSAVERQALSRVAGWMEAALTAAPAAEAAAHELAGLARCIVLGRGYEYPTAREWALKLTELAHVFALPFSAADFEHGPAALAEPDLDVLVIAPAGPPLDAQAALLARLAERHAARLTVISDTSAPLPVAARLLSLPPAVAGWLRPAVSIIPGQLFAYHLTRAKGLDPDTPRTISKVTQTR
ncbi:MAG TPA: SIS domain-containing protein [Candidatus Limnocylindria bacterium]|nr:SIS domain-containing protein [Candidatus Limnocylindria bacterium]